MKKRFLSVLLAILMLGSFVACTPPTPTTENTEGETKNTTVEVTVPDTEPATDPSFDWSQWKPATGADVTELAISGTVDGEEDTGPVEFTYVYEANDPEFVAYDVECEGTTVTFPADKLRSLEMAEKPVSESPLSLTHSTPLTAIQLLSRIIPANSSNANLLPKLPNTFFSS